MVSKVLWLGLGLGLGLRQGVRARVRVRAVELVLPVQLLDALARGGEERVEQVLHLVRV